MKLTEDLKKQQKKENKSHLYMDMIVLIEQIADYIIPKNNTIRKGLGDVMGGKILKITVGGIAGTRGSSWKSKRQT